MIQSLSSQQPSEYKLGISGTTKITGSSLPLGPCASDFTHEEMGIAHSFFNLISFLS